MFHALADATRRDILLRTLEDEHSVSALARRYPMSFAAVQKHVAVLEAAGLVSSSARAASSLSGATSTPCARPIETQFPSLQAMEQLLSTGMEEGITAAMGQIEQILAEG